MVTNFFNEYKALIFENDLQISIFETIRLFKFLFFLPFNLNVKCTQHIRTILFMRLKIHTNSYFTNTVFHRGCCSSKKEKKKMYAYHRIDLFRNKAPYEKNIYIYNFNVDISIQIHPFCLQSTKKHGKQNIIYIQAPVHRQNLFFYLFLIFLNMHIVLTISNPYLFVSQKFLRKTSLSRKRKRIASISIDKIFAHKIFTYRGKQRDR